MGEGLEVEPWAPRVMSQWLYCVPASPGPLLTGRMAADSASLSLEESGVGHMQG